MKKLLHIEQIKLLNYNPFRITIGIYFLAFTLGLLIYPAVDREIPVISLSDLFRFPDVWLFLTWVTEPYNILLALIVIMITTQEFSDHTFTTQIIFGMSRTDLLLQNILIEIFQRRMNSSEPIDETTMELLPKGVPAWLNIMMVMLFISLFIWFSHRLLQRRRLT